VKRNIYVRQVLYAIRDYVSPCILYVVDRRGSIFKMCGDCDLPDDTTSQSKLVYYPPLGQYKAYWRAMTCTNTSIWVSTNFAYYTVTSCDESELMEVLL